MSSDEFGALTRFLDTAAGDAYLRAAERSRKAVGRAARAERAKPVIAELRRKIGEMEASLSASASGHDADIMTLTDVAAYLRVDVATVRRLLHEIPHFTVGGEVRFRRAALTRWVQAQEQQAAPSGIAGPALALVPDEGVPWALVG